LVAVKDNGQKGRAAYVTFASVGLICFLDRAPIKPSAMITTALARNVGIPIFRKPNPFAIGPIVWFGFSEVAANNAFALGRLGTLNEAPGSCARTYVAPASAGLVCRSSRAQTMPSAMITTALASKVGILPTFRMPNP
jgi:hypothetical protein